jgi:hypothetical protein
MIHIVTTNVAMAVDPRTPRLAFKFDFYRWPWIVAAGKQVLVR